MNRQLLPIICLSINKSITSPQREPLLQMHYLNASWSDSRRRARDELNSDSVIMAYLSGTNKNNKLFQRDFDLSSPLLKAISIFCYDARRLCQLHHDVKPSLNGSFTSCVCPALKTRNINGRGKAI